MERARFRDGRLARGRQQRGRAPLAGSLRDPCLFTGATRPAARSLEIAEADGQRDAAETLDLLQRGGVRL